MKVCAAIATILLGLTATACTTSTAAAPEVATEPALSTIATPTTTATPSGCSDFLDNYFIGSPPSKAIEAKTYGWTFVLWDEAGNTEWATSDPWEIGAVEKNPATCSVRFKVVADGPIAAPSPATPAGPLTTVSDGTYLVGTDMAAGSYKSPGSTNGCYWARLKDDSGRNIIANDLVSGPGPARFTAKKGEYVKVSLCTFTKI